MVSVTVAVSMIAQRDLGGGYDGAAAEEDCDIDVVGRRPRSVFVHHSSLPVPHLSAAVDTLGAVSCSFCPCRAPRQAIWISISSNACAACLDSQSLVVGGFVRPWFPHYVCAHVLQSQVQESGLGGVLWAVSEAMFSCVGRCSSAIVVVRHFCLV